MKTASKFLSMLLLVAMCLSLLGGSAFAAGLGPAAAGPAAGHQPSPRCHLPLSQDPGQQAQVPRCLLRAPLGRTKSRCF